MEGLGLDLLRHCGAFRATTAILWCDAAHAHQRANQVSPEDRYDLRRLNYPPATELVSVERSGVHTYDSVEIIEVNAKLDQNFERVQNIMSSRINHLAATGSGPADVEDDGYDRPHCDKREDCKWNADTS